MRMAFHASLMNCRPTYDSTLPLSGYVLSSAGLLTSSVANIQKEVERLGGTFQSKIDENVGIVISSQGEIHLFSPFFD